MKAGKSSAGRWSCRACLDELLDHLEGLAHRWRCRGSARPAASIGHRIHEMHAHETAPAGRWTAARRVIEIDEVLVQMIASDRSFGLSFFRISRLTSSFSVAALDHQIAVAEFISIPMPGGDELQAPRLLVARDLGPCQPGVSKGCRRMLSRAHCFSAPRLTSR